MGRLNPITGSTCRRDVMVFVKHFISRTQPQKISNYNYRKLERSTLKDCSETGHEISREKKKVSQKPQYDHLGNMVIREVKFKWAHPLGLVVVTYLDSPQSHQRHFSAVHWRTAQQEGLQWSMWVRHGRLNSPHHWFHCMCIIVLHQVFSFQFWNAPSFRICRHVHNIHKD